MIYGKAILNVKCDDIAWRRYSISVSIQTAHGGRFAMFSAQDDLIMLTEGGLPGLGWMECGDSVVMSIKYSIEYTQDWEGDWDAQLVIDKHRVLRKKQLRCNRPENLLLTKTLTHKVLDYTRSFPGDAGVKHLTRLASAIDQKLEFFIRYTIRWTDQVAIEQLIEILPNAFPRILRHGPVKVSQNIHGAWRVTPVTASGRRVTKASLITKVAKQLGAEVVELPLVKVNLDDFIGMPTIK